MRSRRGPTFLVRAADVAVLERLRERGAAPLFEPLATALGLTAAVHFTLLRLGTFDHGFTSCAKPLHEACHRIGGVTDALSAGTSYMVATGNHLLYEGAMMDEVLPLRRASRELIRELGFLEVRDAATGVSHSRCHALIEIEGRPGCTQAELAAALRLDKSRTSRLVAELERDGLVEARADAADRRVRRLRVTARGKATLANVHRSASGRVEAALAVLDVEERRTVLAGLQLYAVALERSRRRAEYAIRPIRKGDREAVALLIRTVMPEFGAEGPGFAILDPEVDDMPRAYRGPRAGYHVVVRDGARGESVVVGGGGFAPLVGADDGTCELRKMYFLPEARGLGIGQDLLARCIEGATQAGFTRMYLETLTNMTAARALYERAGFTRVGKPLGSTGHFGCNTFYVRTLATSRAGRRPSPRTSSRAGRARRTGT